MIFGTDTKEKYFTGQPSSEPFHILWKKRNGKINKKGQEKLRNETNNNMKGKKCVASNTKCHECKWGFLCAVLRCEMDEKVEWSVIKKRIKGSPPHQIISNYFSFLRRYSFPFRHIFRLSIHTNNPDMRMNFDCINMLRAYWRAHSLHLKNFDFISLSFLQSS